MKRIVIALVCFSFAFSLSAQTREEKRQQKQENKQQQYELAKEVIDKGMFSFRSTWMNTQGGKRILMDAGRGFLTINDSNAEAYFPYFGTVRVATMYEGGGIEFNTTVEEYKVTYNDERRIITIAFDVDGKNEKYDVIIQLFNGLSAKVIVTSDKRDSISYDGTVSPLQF